LNEQLKTGGYLSDSKERHREEPHALSSWDKSDKIRRARSGSEDEQQAAFTGDPVALIRTNSTHVAYISTDLKGNLTRAPTKFDLQQKTDEIF
jgi:hypothetical protein